MMISEGVSGKFRCLNEPKNHFVINMAHILVTKSEGHLRQLKEMSFEMQHSTEKGKWWILVKSKTLSPLYNHLKLI